MSIQVPEVENLLHLAVPRRHQLLFEWNDTASGDVLDMDVLQAFESCAKLRPEAVAVESGEEAVTFGELAQRWRCLAGHLQSMGVGPESLVGVCLDRSPRMIEGILGILGAGGAYLPLDPSFPAERLSYILEDSGTALVLTEERLAQAPWMGGVRRILLDGPSLGSPEAALTPAGALPGNLAYVLYTSGSTGRPKGVQVTRGALANFLFSMARQPGFAAGESLLAVTTLSFDIAALELFLPLMAGGKVVIASRDEAADGGRLIERLARSGAGALQATPATWRMLIDAGWGPAPTLRALCGGEALGADLAERLLQRAGSVWNLYGPTETTIWSCVSRVQAVDGSPSIGRPIRNTRIYILDRDGDPAPAGVAGELCIAGQGLARGYLGRPDLTAERFAPCPWGEPGDRLYRTGDLARWRPDGTLEYLGRIDHQVKIHGFRIELGEVESELARHPAVRSAVVAAHEDSAGEKRLAAWYTVRELPGPALEELRDWLRRLLPDYMIPAFFLRLEELPLTPNGKVDRRALPAPGAGRNLPDVPFEAPRGELEQRLAALWAEAAGVEVVGALDDFFLIGGDSLRGALLVNRLQQDLGEPLYVMSLFAAPTPALYAGYLRRQYAEAVRRRFPGEESAAPEGGDGKSPLGIGAEEVARMTEEMSRRFRGSASSAVQRKARPAVFILSPPRAGSTLLRVMLAGHPRLFSPPELHLLAWETLAERAAALEGRDGFLGEGLLRTVMELEGVGAEAAARRVDELAAAGTTTTEAYRFLQERIGDRLLVDKTPTYAFSLDTLRRSERIFEGALYLHLVRHPSASVRSYRESRMDQVYGLPFEPQRQAELVWLISHRNIVSFLAEVPPERWRRVRFEDLVRDPRATMEEVSRFLGLELALEMLRPYEGNRMTDGLHATSRMLGDPRFHEHRQIEAAMAERWSDPEGGELSGMTWSQAAAFGYDRPDRPAARAGAGGRLSGPVPVGRERPLPLSPAQERLWLVDKLLAGATAYNVPMLLRLTGELDREALRRALEEVVRRHEVLRTVFPVVGGNPVQGIEPPVRWELPRVDLAGCPEAFAQVERLARDEAWRGFDLERGPILRALLVEVGEGEHYLLLTVHHIACDGWSRGLIVRELGALYEAFAAGQPSPLPELPIQYADFAVWQRSWLAGDLLTAQLGYWRERLAGAPVLDVPADRPRPAVPGFRGGEREIRFSADLDRSLRALGRSRGATSFMVFLALYQSLLYRYTGQEDFVIGAPIANRNRAEVESLIGFFVNTLALRADLSGAPRFAELVDRVRETALAAYAHQDLPFERLVEELQPERDLRRNPVFDLVFVLQGFTMPEVRLRRLSMELLEREFGTAKFDLSLIVTEDGRGSLARLQYSSGLFDPPTASRMLGHLLTLAQGAAASPDAAVSELPLLSAPERQQLEREWDGPQPGLRPACGCLHEAFEEQARRTPAALAVEQGEQRMTYAELSRRADLLARHLVRLGVGPEVPVALCLERSPACVIGLMAILKAGGIYLPMDPDYPPQRRTFLLRHSGARALLSTPAVLSSWQGFPDDLGLPVLDPHHPLAAPGEPDGPEGPWRAKVSPRNLAYIFYTSGSTGTPKGVGVEHGAALEHVETIRRAYGIEPSDRVLQFVSLGFDVSLEQILAPLVCGAALVLREGDIWSPREMLPQLARLGITFGLLPTAYLDQCVREWAETRPGPVAGLRLRRLAVGGEALSAAIPPFWDAFREEVEGDGPPLVNAYGPTEAVVAATLFPASPDPARRSWLTAVPIGRPLPGRSARVLDREGNPVPVNAPGELWLGGVLARGYLRSPDLTAERFLPDLWSEEPGARLYRTGDLVRWNREGTIEFLGRVDHQVKIRGFRIELGEIEAVLGRHPGVRRAVVLLRPEPGGEPRLVAYVEVGGGPAPSIEDLRAFVRTEIPHFMVPSGFLLLSCLPTNSNGKVDRRALLALAPEVERTESFEPPRTPVEELLAEVWSEVLGVERIGIDDNFFTLGGHSLKATQMVSLIGRILRIEVPMRLIFEAPTVAELGRALGADPATRERVEKAARLWLEVSTLSEEDAVRLGEREVGW